MWSHTAFDVPMWSHTAFLQNYTLNVSNKVISLSCSYVTTHPVTIIGQWDDSELADQIFSLQILTVNNTVSTYLCMQCVAQEILIVEKALGNFHFILRLEMHVQNFIALLARSDPVA